MADPTQHRSTTSRVVLVIEDNPLTRKFVRLTLGNEGLGVIEASDAAEGLALAQENAPDLILQDLLLPDMDGFDLVDRLRALPEIAAVPIIAFSGFLSRLEYARAAALGFTDFLPKPVEPSRLVDVVRSHLPLHVAPAARIGGGQRVLLVDDDPVQNKLGRIRLADLGFDVTTANDGAAALEVLRAGGIDAVLSDVLMPRLDGFRLCAAIRNDPALCHVPVVLVSSNYVDHADGELARSMGADSFVVRTPDLGLALDALMKGLRASHPPAPVPIDPDPALHRDRVVRQLERQAAMNAAFAHRLSMHATMLSVVVGISHGLTCRQTVDHALPELLATLLDAAGVSRGALFLKTAGSPLPAIDMALAASLGFSESAAGDLAAFFHHRELFDRAVATRSPVGMARVADSNDHSAEQDLLACASAQGALVVPLMAHDVCEGVLLLLSSGRDLTESDWLTFARMISAQIGQALALNRAFSRLAASENRYRVLMEGARDAIFTLDRAGLIRDANPPMAAFLGRPRSELLGAPLATFLAGEELERWERESSSMLTQGRGVVDLCRFVRPRGEIVIGDLSMTAVDVDGEVLALGIMRDVTRKEKADAKLRLLQSVSLAASEAADLTSAFDVVLRTICGAMGWPFGAAWVPSAGNPKTLECRRYWTRDGADRERFGPLCDTVFVVGDGVLGRTWSSQRPMLVPDVASEKGLRRRAAALILGLHVAFAVPVVAQGRVIAVIEFFMHEAGDDIQQSVDLVSTIAAQIASVIERKHAEEALRLQDARFRALIENSQDGIALTSEQGATLYMSPAGKRILGCDTAEFSDWCLLEFVLPEDRYRISTAQSRILARPGASINVQFRIAKPDGSQRWLESTITNMLHEPAIGAMVANFTDTTERKRALDDLRASEARFARLAESGIIGIAFADVFGGVHDVNEACAKMLGYTREELMSAQLSWSAITPPEWRETDALAIGQLQTNGIAPAWEKEFLRKDGTRVEVLIGVAMLDYPACIAFLADLSDRKRAEQALRQTEEQLRHAQKMEAIGRLAGGVAHDFNNMLSVILSYGELLRMDLKQGDPMRDDVEQIMKAGTRAAALTRQLLMFSRQQVLEPKVLDLNDVLAGMDKMLQRMVGEDVDLASISGSSLGRVQVDASSIEQVIMNLVVNARDAMPTGGKLTIETGNVVLDEAYARDHVGAKAGPHVLLAVTDTGNGMDKATCSHIFEPFFTTKEKGKGTGLGLSTVFGIVQQSGGSIWVYSEPGKGTTFKVYLPRVDGAAQSILAPEPSASALRGTETILLVEDEDQLRQVACGILRRHGYRVLDARHAGEALLMCEKHPGAIDLLVSDVVMPQMSGPDLAKRLSVVRPEMKVLCMSGYTDDSIVRHGVLEGDVAFLQKPVTPQSLTRKVREVLDAPPRNALLSA